MASVPTGWHYSVFLQGGGFVFPQFVFTYTHGIGLSRGQSISTDDLAQYINENFQSVRKMNSMNGCVRAQNETNNGHLQDIRKKKVNELTVIGIAPVYE